MFRKENLRILIFECLGTMLLSIGTITTAFKLPIPQHTANSPMLHDIYISLSLYLGILFFGPLSGVNFNPAVSIGLYLNSHTQRMKLSTLGCYLVGQFVGAVVGCAFCYGLFGVGAGPFSADETYGVRDVGVRVAGELIGIV